MKPISLGAWLRKITDFITFFLVGYASLCAVVMMLHVTADVTGRYLWRSFPGTHDIVTNWYMVGFIFLTIAFVEYERGHISVTFVKDRLGQRMRTSLDIFALVVMFAVFFAFGWYTWSMALKSLAIKEYWEAAIKIYIWPVAFYLPIGSWALCAQLLVHIVESCASLIRGQSQ